MKIEYGIRLGFISALFITAIAAAIPTGLAFAGDCDGTAGDDDGISNPVIVCASDPIAPDDTVGLGFGDDVYSQNVGVSSVSVIGDADEDGTTLIGNGDDDKITIDGNSIEVLGDSVDGDGGDDAIFINGMVFAVAGDGNFLSGNGGNDYIEINGIAFTVAGDALSSGNGGDDTIVVNGYAASVSGDLTFSGDGGNDTIIINGEVDDVFGDDVFGAGGDDLIIVNGIVNDDVCGDCSSLDGDDTVIIGNGAYIGGDVDGQGGFDTLKFSGLRQSQLAGLDPAGDSITVGGNTYYWFDFEQLIGLLQELASSNGFRILFQSNSLLAVDQLDGIAVFAEHGRVAFIAFSSLDFGFGETQTYSTPNGAGWYMVVTNLGDNPHNPANTLYQVSIFDAGGSQQAQFIFSN